MEKVDQIQDSSIKGLVEDLRSENTLSVVNEDLVLNGFTENMVMRKSFDKTDSTDVCL